MFGLRYQTKVRCFLWRLNTFYQKLQMVLWFLCLCNYHFAWGSEPPSVLLLRSFVEKHVLFIESSREVTSHSLPFVDIKQAFDRVQGIPYFINEIVSANKRKRHFFMVTSNENATKEDMVRTFTEKIEQIAKVERKIERKTHQFVVYKISFKELRSHAVNAIDLDITFGTKNSYYSIKSCMQSDSGTFDLGAEVSWTTRVYKINHVENVILQNPKPCENFSLQNPSGTCRT